MNADKRKRAASRFALSLIIVTLVYIVSYCLNSFFGGYWLIPEMDGRDRYSFGLAIPTAVMWQPLVGHEAIGNLDYFGAFYTPLIRFDRKSAHPTIYMSDDDGETKISNLKISQVHPYWRDEFAAEITAVADRDESKRAIICTFRYTGSNHSREIREIQIRKELAIALDASPPGGFVEMAFEEYQEYEQENYVRWIGRLALPIDQDVILTIPAKQPKAGKGSITFYYERTDTASPDFRNCCFASLQ